MNRSSKQVRWALLVSLFLLCPYLNAARQMPAWIVSDPIAAAETRNKSGTATEESEWNKEKDHEENCFKIQTDACCCRFHISVHLASGIATQQATDSAMRNSTNYLRRLRWYPDPLCPGGPASRL